jgi:hypothetical protein
MKAIKITKDNRQLLASRFNVDVDDYDDMLPIGYWLVTDFGNDDTFDTLTEDMFQHNFIVGDTLENDFVAVERD